MQNAQPDSTWLKAATEIIKAQAERRPINKDIHYSRTAGVKKPSDEGLRRQRHLPDSSGPQKPHEEIPDDRSGNRAPKRNLQDGEWKFLQRLNFRPEEWSREG